MKRAPRREPLLRRRANTRSPWTITEGEIDADAGDPDVIRSGRRVAEVVAAPGSYDDGPVFLRVNRRAAGRRWPVPGFSREVNDHALENDEVHDWVRVPQNSRAAHAYRDRLIQEHGLGPRAVAVVRFRTVGDDTHPFV